MNGSNTLKQKQNAMEKDTLFGIPKTKCSRIEKIRRNLSQHWFELLVDNQVEEDLIRLSEEECEGMCRYMAESDREHKRVHDMRYLGNLKILQWSNAIKDVYNQRFYQGLLIGWFGFSLLIIFSNIIHWWRFHE